jgi:hypothetical protein
VRIEKTLYRKGKSKETLYRGGRSEEILYRKNGETLYR